MRRVQKRGWSWNTDYNFALAPDISGNVYVPNNALKVTFVGSSADLNLVQRGNRIYDANNHSFTFTTSIHADVVTMLPFDQLSEAARQFIFVSAMLRYQAGFVGSDILDKYVARDAQQAW